jgi:hypothetical protein
MDEERDSHPRAAAWYAWLGDAPRPVPRVRALRTGLRILHLIAFGSLYGGHVYGIEAERLLSSLFATVASGAALMGLEIYRLPVWLIQVRGLATLVKILLLVSVVALWEVRVVLLTLAIVIGGVAAHMPSDWRYYSPLHGRVVGPQEKG